MADTDFSSYILRYDLLSNQLQYFQGSDFYPVSMGSGTPAGSNTQIQFNSSGSFGASAGLTWVDSNRALKVLGSTPGTGGDFIVSSSDGAHTFEAYADTTSTVVILANMGLLVKPTTSGPGTPDVSACVEFDSTTQGLLIPRMSTSQRTSISSPADGLLVYDNTLDQLYQWQLGQWTQISPTNGTPVVTFTGTGTVTPSAVLTSTLSTTVSGTLTIHGPTGGVDGQKLTFRILNDASHSVTFATGSGNFSFGTDITSYTNSVSLTDYIGAIYNSTTLRWNIVSVIQGF